MIYSHPTSALRLPHGVLLCYFSSHLLYEGGLAEWDTDRGLSMRGLQRGWLQLSASASNQQQRVNILLEGKVKMRACRNEEPQSADTEVCHGRSCDVYPN